jgi:hypothetical protein
MRIEGILIHAFDLAHDKESRKIELRNSDPLSLMVLG